MWVPTLVMAVVAGLLFLVAYSKGQGQHLQGLMIGLRLTAEVLPLLVLSFVAAGIIQVLVPRETLGKWIGEESGWRGILVGTLTGAIAPGGPYVSLPIAAGLMRAGAGVGTMVAFLTAWSLWAVGRLPMEIGIMGWRFALIRLSCTFFFPPIAGFLAQTLFSGVRLQ
ncbi:MAG: permease [candidate division KSB1 bacterium]|nr:permease [candidate division KSB1 bacterium]